MYSLFKDAEKLIYRKPKVQDPRPDNVVFRLHYQYTFTVLAVCVILVTSYGYIDSAGVATNYISSDPKDINVHTSRFCNPMYGGQSANS